MDMDKKRVDKMLVARLALPSQQDAAAGAPDS
jgi:hypothetical protein